MSVRMPDFAGSWYPDTKEDCLRLLAQFESRCAPHPRSSPVRGGIVPHAGWFFSGRIAYQVVWELSQGREKIDTIVLFGGHLHSSSPLTIMPLGRFWTPLGEIPIDQELSEALLTQFEMHRETPEHHTHDNTVELQAPLIKHLMPQVKLVVIAAPPREETLRMADAVVEMAAKLGRQIVALGSTDLTHYGPNYGWSPKGTGPDALHWVKEENDRRWIELACKLDSMGVIQEAQQHSNACCSGAAAAAIQCGLKMGALSGELLTYATSADIRPDKSFVGYAGIIF